MNNKQGKPTRKHGLHLRVPVLPEEEACIKENAAAAGLSVAAYLRNVGMGYEIAGILDHRRVDDLARINADLGRLGGLLKLWLSSDERTSRVGPEVIHTLLEKIERNQTALFEAASQVVRR